MYPNTEEQKLFDDLMRLLELDNKDKVLWNDKCDYYQIEKCNNLNPEYFNLVVLQLNIRSILAHEMELKCLLHNLDKRNSPVNVVLLSETFLSTKTKHLVNIRRYTIISKCRQHSKGGGVCILLKDNITFKHRKDLDEMVEK